MEICYNGVEVKIDDLEKYHTKQLLNILRECQKFDWNYYGETDWDYIELFKNKLRQILSTREHIPSKKESREIRLAKIKKGR